MKLLPVTFILLLYNTHTFAQSAPQLRLRLGIIKALPASTKYNEQGLYKFFNKQSPYPSGIGFEYYKPLKQVTSALIIGANLSFQPYVVGINPDKFSVVPSGPGIASDYGSIRMYIGLEERLGKINIPMHKNYFSIFMNIGLSYNSSGSGDGSWRGTTIEDGITIDGKIFTGEYYDGRGNPAFAGYYSQLRAHAAHTFSPDLAAGFRWNIRNKKGKTVLVTELQYSIGITTKYYMDIAYRLNGQSTFDRLKDKGMNFQLNTVIPLFSFRNKK